MADVDVSTDEEDLDLEVDPDAEGDEADDDELDELKNVTPEEFKKLQAKLAKTRREARSLRIQNRKLRDGEDPADEKTMEERKRVAEVGKWRDRAIKQAARAAVIQKGADSEFVDLLVGKIKAAEIDFDDDDEPILEDWLEEMEERYPKVFAPSAPRVRRVPTADQSAATAKPAKPKPRYGDSVLAAGYKLYGQSGPRRRA